MKNLKNTPGMKMKKDSHSNASARDVEKHALQEKTIKQL